MKVWIVNPFDPLPGEPERAGRFAHLAYALHDAGHTVMWWTAEFSHRFKRNVDTARVRALGAERGIDIRCLPVPPYTRNISLRRLWSHRVFGHAVADALAKFDPPDVITASAPPLDSTWAATRYGASHGIPTVVDILDQWPDTFARSLPRYAQPFGKICFGAYYKAERVAYGQATGIIGVAQGYLDRGIKIGGAKAHTAVLHLGVDLAEFDNAMHQAQAKPNRKWIKPQDETWVIYGGSLSHSYDFETIFHAASRVRAHFGQRVRFIIAGAGDLESRAKALHADLNLDTVSMPGFLPLAEWAELLSQADVGLMATFPKALIYMPYKVHDYLAAGVAILNTLPGECGALITEHHCGLNYRAGDVDDLFSAIKHVVDHPEERRAMGTSARRLAETEFDRRIISQKYVEFLERVATDR